ncbi:MAG: hypothetical protein O3B13_22365 [Planctomycetota bacterium]|nr:hypothetical protein [Planctomycetota bacterium]MDA1165853.1 hypothetical protein [Planctomycetota bacterium]
MPQIIITALEIAGEQPQHILKTLDGIEFVLRLLCGSSALSEAIFRVVEFARIPEGIAGQWDSGKSHYGQSEVLTLTKL